MKRFLMLALAGLLATGLGYKAASAATIDLAEGSGNGKTVNTSGQLSLTNPPFSGPVDINFSFSDTEKSTISVFICSGSLANCNSGGALAGGGPLVGLKSLTFTADALALGNYFFKLAFSSAVAGDFTWKFSAEGAVTPIPGAGLLLLTALGGLGFVGYRRKKSIS